MHTTPIIPNYSTPSIPHLTFYPPRKTVGDFFSPPKNAVPSTRLPPHPVISSLPYCLIASPLRPHSPLPRLQYPRQRCTGSNPSPAPTPNSPPTSSSPASPPAKPSSATKLVILGHHYQQDDVIRFADVAGDSFQLSREAAKLTHAQYIVFCGVHFMAESADILTADHQQVILPDLGAGCSMADMAHLEDVEDAWAAIHEACRDIPDFKLVPITYMNSSAAIKAFVGEHGGAVCTSSNCEKILRWALR